MGCHAKSKPQRGRNEGETGTSKEIYSAEALSDAALTIQRCRIAVVATDVETVAEVYCASEVCRRGL